MKKEIKNRPLSVQVKLDNTSKFPDVLQRIYAGRSVNTSSDLEKELTQLLPFHELKNISQAVELLYQALCNQWRIVIIADYDADGATSCALAIRALRAFGARYVDYIVPNRFKHGYGLTPDIVQLAKAKSAELLVTVDNGIASCDGVDVAKSYGMKVLITDHHLPGEQLPAADAIVNPNQAGDTFSSKALAGVGVIFYIMIALRSYLRAQQWFVRQALVEPHLADLLDMVALGTVADVVPLDKNNRILVHHGLRRINQQRCVQGIKALLSVAKRQQYISASDLAFAVGPRLNAAGRLEDMSLSIECLLTDDEHVAHRIAHQLDQLNQERRSIEMTMQHQAFAALAKVKLDHTDALAAGLCLYDKTWHQGVIGILASRLKDHYHRPVICFAKADGGEVKGSARSIPSVHIRDVLTTIANRYPLLIKKYGGHAMAAGLTLSEEQLPWFKHCFEEVIGTLLSARDLQPIIWTDGILQENDFCIDLADTLRDAGPWGQHFPEPSFHGEFLLAEQRLVAQKHLKLVVSPFNSSRLLDAIAFNVDMAHWPNYRCRAIHAVYRLDINEYRGARDVQLVIEYMEAHETQSHGS